MKKCNLGEDTSGFFLEKDSKHLCYRYPLFLKEALVHCVKNDENVPKRWCKNLFEFVNLDYMPRKRTIFVIQIDNKKSKLLY